MRQKSTNDLNQELMAQPNLDKYITENETHFTDVDISAFLLELYERCRLSKAELARQAGMSEVYLHQIFSGRRKPSRDRLLCLCAGLEAGLEDIQQLLKQAGYAPPLPQAEAGRHHHPRHPFSHAAERDERQAVFRERKDAFLRGDTAPPPARRFLVFSHPLIKRKNFCAI